MPISALILITQGPNTDVAGNAVKGTVTDGSVTWANDDDTGVLSWKYELLSTPPGSGISPVTQGPNATPTFTTTQPDVPGSYRVRLTVSDGLGGSDVDIRNLVVPFPIRGIMAPPYQMDPEPLPTLASGLPGAKPNEMNLGGQEVGWMGDADPTRPLLYQALGLLDAGSIPPGVFPQVLAYSLPGDVLIATNIVTNWTDWADVDDPTFATFFNTTNVDGDIGTGFSVIGRWRAWGTDGSGVWDPTFDFEVTFTLGAGFNPGTGDFTFSIIPGNLSTQLGNSPGIVGTILTSYAVAYDVGTPANNAIGHAEGAFGSLVSVRLDMTLGGADAGALLSATVPFTWATGDQIRITGHVRYIGND